MSDPDPPVGSAFPRESPPPSAEAPKWERQLIERLALESLAEQRRARRWKWAFRITLLSLCALVALVWLWPEWPGSDSGGPHSALVDVRGTISESGGESADHIVAALRAAFEDSGTAGVILRINSPGGSPVQAGYVSDEIARLRSLHPDTPIYAVIGDVTASGGYYIAAATDRIFASRSSIVGSIGVLMNGFGFVEALEKLGIERRLLAAGEHKALLDPFSPVRSEEVAHLRALLEEVHRHFIEVVKRGRGDRLAEDDRIFSGLVWSGSRAVELGLVDAFGSSGHVAREVIGAEDIVDFTVRPSHLDVLVEHLGASIARTLGAELGLGTGLLQ